MLETETGVSPDEHLFQMTCLVSAKDVRLSARSEIGNRQLLALVTGSGDITIHYLSGDMNQRPVMRWIPWFADSNRRITALCFDPSGSWLLVAGNDGSIFIIPALSLVDQNTVLEQQWSTTDLTYIPSPLLRANPSNSGATNILRSHPTSIVWWQSLLECHHVAIMGTDCGDLIFVSLTTGLQVGITFVRANISLLHICQDNSLDSVFLLITSDNRSQWKLLLEQRATGYGWPIDSSGSAVKVVTSNKKLASSNHTCEDLESGNRNGSYLPSTRSRLQGLKQLSVKKLTSLRQRLAETRSKGTSAMAVNIHFRRESSGSSNDDTVCSSSMDMKPAATESSDLPPVHHVTTGPQPERLSSELDDTFMYPQFARGRHLLSGYYAPTSIVSIHGMNLDVVSLFVHKLAQQCRDIVVTDRFLYVTDIDGKSLSVVSCQLSESRICSDSDYNPESVIERFEMKDSNERILSLYKRSCSNYCHWKPSGVSSKQSLVASDKDCNPQVSFDKKSEGSCREKEKKSSSQTPFCLPKSVKELKLDMPSIDGCVIVTTNGVYEVNLRLSPAEMFMDLVLTYQAIEKAEKLAVVFGLNLQQLLEVAGDLKLSAKDFPQAIALYKLSKCRHLKSVLKFAAAGHTVELLSYITLLFSTAGVDLTASEKIHLSNLAVMSYTEQVLRATVGRVKLLKQFLKFLRENLYYDEVLAVNVAGQTGLWEILQFLASMRGLHPEVLDILTKIVKSLSDGLVKADNIATTSRLPALDSGLWLCMSDPSLLQSLLSKPQQARIHLQFVCSCMPHLEQFALQRLAALYDPSLPQLRPSMKRMFKMGRRREHSSGSYSSYSAQTDSLDLLDSVDEIFVPIEDVVQTFLLILLYLAKKRQASSPTYIPELMEKIQLPKDDDDDENSEDLYPSLPVHVTSLSAGFSHVALIRNGAVYTWGNAVQGCLGTGPTMSRYSCPQQISMLPGLKVEVISVSCGRQHTLSLTSNGVYAWGSSQYGQLGIGKSGQSPYPRLVELLSRERIIAVSAGQYHSIALADDGRVFTWGWGVHGQLGHHSVEDCHIPTLVERLIGKVVTQICGGHGHTVCLTAEGQVYTFGSSVFGQLGNGSNVKSSVPVHVTALTERITIIATNYFHNLAVSSSNKLYMWGSSPQVLRLQAQAQKKARLLQQQQHLSASVTPLSPSKPITPQVQSTLGVNSDISSPLLHSPTPGSAATSVHVTQQDSSGPSYHSSTLTESLKEELPNLNLKVVSDCYDSDLPSSVQARVNLKNNVLSHPEVPSSLLSNSTDSLDSTSSVPKSVLNSVKCHIFSSENNSSASEVDNKGYVNSQKQSSQNSHEFPIPKRERICEEQVTEMSDSEKSMQKSESNFFGSEEQQESFQSLCESGKVQSGFFGSEEKREAFQSLRESDKISWNKKSLQLPPGLSQDSSESSAQPVLSTVSSDFESADKDTLSRNMHPPGSLFASRRKDQNRNLKVKPSHPPLTATTAEGYSIAALIVSPTMEFKGLTAGPPPLDNNFASPDEESNNQSSRSELDDGQSHLTPQLVDTSLVVGRIVQVSCGCHHSALLTNEGVLYMWGRNLDGQLGNGTRKEIPIPTPLTSAAASATASTKTSSLSKSPSVSGVLSAGENLRLKQVSCGGDFTVAQESAHAGKIWAWGNNSQAQLGRVLVEESKGLEGKLVMLKTTKRVVKLPHGSQNSSDVPRTVPDLPNTTLSFKYDNLSGIGGCSSHLIRTCTDFCPALCSIEEPCYGLRTLHYALQHFHGYYDSKYLLNKCLALENYQGAAKLAALDRHYHLALAYQLKALALAMLEFGSNLEQHLENQGTDFSKKADERLYGSNKTCTKSSNSALNFNKSQDYSNEHKMRSTHCTFHQDVVNTDKNKNSNPVLVNYKEEFKVYVSDVNSSRKTEEQFGVSSNTESCSASNKTKVTENTVTDSNLVGKTIVSTEAVVNVSRINEDTGYCDKDNDDTTVNKMRRNSLVLSTADFEENIPNSGDLSDVVEVPPSSNSKIKSVTESKTETQSISKVEDKNWRNVKVDLLYSSETKSEVNEVINCSKTPEGKPKVEFSGEICIHINESLKPDLIFPLAQSNTDEVKLEFNTEEELKLRDSKQETNLIKPLDYISSKTQVNTVEELETSSSVSTPESLPLCNVHDSEIHAFAVQGGTEQMSEGHHLTSPDCSTSLVSEEQGLLNPEPSLPQATEQEISEGQDVVHPEPILPQINECDVCEEQVFVCNEPILHQVNEQVLSEEHGLVGAEPIPPKVNEWELSDGPHLVSPEAVLPQASEQNSQSSGLNLVSITGDGSFQNLFVVSAEDGKNNSDKYQTEVTSNLLPVLNSDGSSTSESFMVIKQENMCEDSGHNSSCFIDGAGLHRNSDADTAAVKNSTMSVASESSEEGSVHNENKEMKNETDNVSHEFQNSMQLYDQENTSATKSLTSDTLNGMADTTHGLNKIFSSCDPNKICISSGGSSEVMGSDCNKFQRRVDLALKSPRSEDSDMLQLNSCGTDEKTSAAEIFVSLSTGLQTSLLLSTTESGVVETTDTITTVGGEETGRALEMSVQDDQNDTEQLSCDRTDLCSYEKELKMSSGGTDFHVSEDAVDDELYMKSTDTVVDEVYDNKFSGNVISAETNVMCMTGVNEAANSSQQVHEVDESNTSDHLTETRACKDLVKQAAAVVEHYVSVMEEDSHAMMSSLLQQGFEFWLSHSLPVDHLENLLLKHMSKFFYPLGLLLFCKTGNTGEEEVETQQQAVSMLNHLSTRFCLQLCSNLLNHIDQKKAYPEYIELLAQVTSVQTSQGLNGCCLTAQGSSQSPEQLMEAILEGLGATKALQGSLGQTCITVQEEVSEASKDLSSETTKLEQLLAFSCGHHYAQSVFYQSVLPELELGLLQLHHPLPNTARVLKGLFCSNSPNLHLACPRCVLSYLQSETTPPL